MRRKKVVRVGQLNLYARIRVVPECVRPKGPVKNVGAGEKDPICGKERAIVVVDGAIVDEPVDLRQRCARKNVLFGGMDPNNGFSVFCEIHSLEPQFFLRLSENVF